MEGVAPFVEQGAQVRVETDCVHEDERQPRVLERRLVSPGALPLRLARSRSFCERRNANCSPSSGSTSRKMRLGPGSQFFDVVERLEGRAPQSIDREVPGAQGLDPERIPAALAGSAWPVAPRRARRLREIGSCRRDRSRTARGFGTQTRRNSANPASFAISIRSFFIWSNRSSSVSRSCMRRRAESSHASLRTDRSVSSRNGAIWGRVRSSPRKLTVIAPINFLVLLVQLGESGSRAEYWPLGTGRGDSASARSKTA